MPVTRSSSTKPSTRLSVINRRNPGASMSATHQASSDVIVLSDSEDCSVSKSKKSTPSKPKTRKTNDKQSGKARAKPLVPLEEVFEISSDEESAKPLSVIADLQAKVQKLQKENASLKTALKVEVDKKKVVLDISQVEDCICCEICTCRLWQPFILPGCGHTFCQSCLVDWFNTTLAQHVTKHPNYNPNIMNQLNGLPAPIRDLLENHGLNAHMQLYIQRIYPHFQILAPMPQYTCPTCREQVKSKPVEDYVLKSLVRTIAGAAGESSPKKSGGRSKSGVARRGGTWDTFFRPGSAV